MSEPLQLAEPTSQHPARWRLCTLLFTATVISYIDRGLISFLKPDLQRDMHWNEIDYSHVVAAFSLAYAIGQFFSGRLMDKIGVRRGLLSTVAVWSAAAAAHAAAGTLLAFESARFALGLAEGGNYPGGAKAVGEWFGQKERAIATGIFNAGSNIGPLITPFLATFITVHLGFTWRACFIAAGAAGLIWLIPWSLQCPAQRPEPPNFKSQISDFKSLLSIRSTWAFIVGLSLTSPIFWFYIYWFPDFLGKSFHLAPRDQQLPIAIVFIIAAIGSITGGLLSSAFIRRGLPVITARKLAMSACAACVIPVFLAPRATNLWIATLLVALAVASHQGFASNLFTLVSDMLPGPAVSSVTGLGGMSAGFIAMVFQVFCGHLLQSRAAGAYYPLFAICSCAYPTSLLCVHLLASKYKDHPTNIA